MGLFDWLGQQPGGGLLGNGMDGGMPVNNLAIIGAILQDIGASYDKRQPQALAALSQQMQKLGQQKKYQDMVAQQFAPGTPNIQLPQIDPSKVQSLGLKGATTSMGGTSVDGRGTLRDMYGPQADTMQAMAGAMDPSQGLPFLANSMGRMQDRQWQVQDTSQQRQWDVEKTNQARQDNTSRPMTDQEKVQRGLNPKLPYTINGMGKVELTDNPDYMTPLQRAQLGISQQELALRKAEAGKGAAPPSGYAWKPDGSGLAFIPGGPADPAVGIRGKGPTEDQAKNTQLYQRASQQLKILIGDEKNPGTFDALASAGNQFGANISNAPFSPFSPSVFTSAEYQRASGALKDIAASYLYSVSGATANPGEVQNLTDTITPKFGDSAATVADKKARVQQMVDSIKERAGPAYVDRAQGGGSNTTVPDPLGLRR